MQINYLHWIALVLVVAQGLTARSVIAQSVQLPTFHYFAVETSVFVPDRGGAALGGVGRSTSAGSQLGPMQGTRAAGSGTVASGVAVHAFIHDFEALDQSALEKAAQLHSGGHRQGRVAMEHMGANKRLDLTLGRTVDTLPSVAEIHRRQIADARGEQDEVSVFLERARNAAEAGKPSVARVYFQMAERRANAALRAQIQAEAATLPSATQAALRKGKH